MNDYTVIIADHSEHREAGLIVVVQVRGETPLDAASNAEVDVASKIFERSYGADVDPINGNHDEEWIWCMEHASTLVVIEGTPKTFVEDAIYEETT